MRRGVFLLSLALLLGWPPFARSQSDAPPPAPPSEAEDPDAKPPVFYETTTVTARPVSSATGSVTVVGPEEARAAEARSASEILQDVPGLQLLSSGGRAGQTNAYVRGGDPNYTLVLLDGLPLNDSTDLQGGAVNLEELPASLVERAEIVRGPFTSFYGTSSLSGVIQLFTPRGGPGPVRASLGAEAGNADLVRGFARASGPAGERGGLAGGLSWDQERHRIAEDRFRQLDAWASANLGLGATTDLRLVGRLADGEADDYPDASGGPVYGSGELRTTDAPGPRPRGAAGDGRPGRAAAPAVRGARAPRARPHQPRGAPAGPGLERAGDVHAAPPLVAGAAPPDVPDRGGRGRLRRRGVGRERECPPAAALPGRRRARGLPRDPLERRGLCRHPARGLARRRSRLGPSRGRPASGRRDDRLRPAQPARGGRRPAGRGNDPPARLRGPGLEAAQLLRAREPPRPRRKPRPAGRERVGRRGGDRAATSRRRGSRSARRTSSSATRTSWTSTSSSSST